MEFASDNSGPAAPEVMEALLRANEGYASSYGAEASMNRVRARIREMFAAPEAAVYLVTTGTAANALALACLCPPWARIYTHETSHLEMDECGAPEFFTGGSKLHLLPGEHGKLTPETLRGAIAATPRGVVHAVQPGAISITNLTEYGAAYGTAEVAALGAVAVDAELPLHMDGARFANAVVGSNADLADLTWRARVRALSFGGTKNGLLGVEAVILFDPSDAWEFELRRKRGAHLMSKHRYLSAQMEAYLTDDLWLRLARKSNAQAQELATGIAGIEGATLLHPVDGNQVFAAFPRGAHRRAMEAGAHYYLWPEDQSLEGPDDTPLSARLVANWSTTAEDVGRLLDLIRG
ncbi:MAG: beta-eliminating lyase-related protein [Pseudomonadota bacterium]